MTLTDLQKLAETDEGREKIRVMVTELHKCKRYLRPFDRTVFLCASNPRDWDVVDLPIDRVNSDVPRYTDDLNACAEFEAGLTDEEYMTFRNWVADIAHQSHPDDQKKCCRAFVSASALHRCMAFILTKQPTKGAE